MTPETRNSTKCTGKDCDERATASSPNVVVDESMLYFGLPKLGTNVAVSLIYSSFLNEKIFDVALAAKKKEN